ncbi:flagella basal body P-ring formation protein FlgA [Paracidobacterium acidisoli]|uniref:Flagella basal body P-ring formation protein FlgA SAF domain-containing protein n=1 Tax=Paracidobacterium acidisoli TaxID=2303751 RepID=A0A372IR64_9BACT|nr:flagella basal body P-ring formation protein FlgA [Paracidobacterium acidisoli]MBT9330312.1 flagella basal body P-ring formation protein FlgA [Paracidobacterium acidisoli]
MRAIPLLIAMLAGSPVAHAAPCRSGSTTRIYRYWEDAGLHRRWAMMIDCAHPDHPALFMPSQETPAAGDAQSMEAARITPSSPQVTNGMRVTLWQRESAADMRLTGTALEAGHSGQKIRVRTGLSGTVLTGVVRGPASVELLPAATGWRKR